MNTKCKIALIAAIAVVLALVIGCGAYVSDYYRADEAAAAALAGSETVEVRQEAGLTVFAPAEPAAGFIFYPGGKVEYTAYAPLMLALAERDVLCLLVEMPLNLAVLDVNAAEGLRERFPEVERWYIGGHSLGGAMAASYAEKNAHDFAGLVLLASYSTADISESGLAVLSVYGSEDGVLNMEKYEKYASKLPHDFEEYVIEGGCHAYFGVYGAQAGDGTPKITNKRQIEITAEKISEFIN